MFMTMLNWSQLKTAWYHPARLACSLVRSLSGWTKTISQIRTYTVLLDKIPVRVIRVFNWNEFQELRTYKYQTSINRDNVSLQLFLHNVHLSPVPVHHAGIVWRSAAVTGDPAHHTVYGHRQVPQDTRHAVHVRHRISGPAQPFAEWVCLWTSIKKRQFCTLFHTQCCISLNGYFLNHNYM